MKTTIRKTLTTATVVNYYQLLYLTIRALTLTEIAKHNNIMESHTLYNWSVILGARYNILAVYYKQKENQKIIANHA